MKHRSRIKITSLRLDIANGGGVIKTKLMNMANFSHKQLKELLMFLTDRDLIYHDIKTVPQDEQPHVVHLSGQQNNIFFLLQKCESA